MKRTMIYAAYAAALLLFSPLAFGYAIYFVDKGSDPACFNDPNDPLGNVVHIFVGKDADSWERYLKSQGIKNKVIETLQSTSGYFKKVAPTLKDLAGRVPDYGELATPLIETAEEYHDVLLVQGPELFDKLFGSVLNAKFRQDAGIIAVHRNVPRGNAGNRAAWNWRDIEKEYNLPKGSTLYITIVGKKNKEIILFNAPIKSDQGFAFIVKKDPATGACFAVPGNFADPGVAMPAGPALRDRNFMEEWINRVNKELIPEFKKNKDPRLVQLEAELAKVKQTVK